MANNDKFDELNALDCNYDVADSEYELYTNKKYTKEEAFQAAQSWDEDRKKLLDEIKNAPVKTYSMGTVSWNGAVYTGKWPGAYVQPQNSWDINIEYTELKDELPKESVLPAISVAKEEKPKRVRYPSYKKNDRVQTPNGPGNVWSVDRDGTVCVELDKDSCILHEFEKKELKKIK